MHIYIYVSITIKLDCLSPPASTSSEKERHFVTPVSACFNIVSGAIGYRWFKRRALERFRPIQRKFSIHLLSPHFPFVSIMGLTQIIFIFQYYPTIWSSKLPSLKVILSSLDTILISKTTKIVTDVNHFKRLSLTFSFIHS